MPELPRYVCASCGSRQDESGPCSGCGSEDVFDRHDNLWPCPECGERGANLGHRCPGCVSKNPAP